MVSDTARRDNRASGVRHRQATPFYNRLTRISWKRGDDTSVRGRRFIVLAVVLVALNASFWLAQGGFALPQSLIQDLFGSRMVRAEVVWIAPDGTTRDTRLDRGRIRSVTSDSITLRELDGSVDAIPLAPNVTVLVGAQAGSLGDLRRGLRVVVTRPANGPADTVRVVSG
jgi:hypothetical protein